MVYIRSLLILLSTLLAACPCLSQENPPAKDPSLGQVRTQSVAISEPATVKVEDLFKQADVVAVVKILSGDTEHYSATVYKAEVVTPFKGVRAGEIVFLGPFVGYRIGWEYLAFLRRAEEEMAPSKETSSSGTSYGLLPSFYRIMYEGYSFMESGYVCVLDGKETSEMCDYGIQFNTYQVVVPKKIKTFPVPLEDGKLSDSKWVRKKPFLDYLETLRFRK